MKVSCEVNLDLNCVHCLLLCSPGHLNSPFYFKMLFTFSYKMIEKLVVMHEASSSRSGQVPERWTLSTAIIAGTLTLLHSFTSLCSE